MEQDKRVFVNGSLEGDPRISVFDRGLQFGEGALETIGVWEGHLVAAGAHLERLRRSLDLLGVQAMVNVAALRDQAGFLAAHFGDGTIKVLVTAGVGQGRVVEEPSRATTIVAHRAATPWCAPALALSAVPACYPLGPAKTLALVAANLAARRRAGADDIVMLTPSGEVAEASTSNLFIHADRQWWTPARGMLPGVTRALFLEYLAGLGEPVSVGVVRPEVLAYADSIVLTNSAVGAMAAARWRERALESPPEWLAGFRAWVLDRAGQGQGQG